jgi:hypothetical protein
MTKFFDLKGIIILILLAICILEFINPKGIMPKRSFTYHDSISVPYAVHDTIPVDSLVEVPVEVDVPVEKQVPYAVHDTFTVKVDTNAIVNNYLNSKSIFTNTYKFTGNQGFITITDTISKNKIVGRKYTTKITPRVDTLRLPAVFKREFYVGLDARFDKPNFVQLMGLGLIMKTKETMLYKLDLGVENQVTDGTNGKFVPYIGGGVYWKLPPKK